MLSTVLQATCPFCLSMKLLRDCGCKYSDVARRHTIVVARSWFLADGHQYPQQVTGLGSRQVAPALPPERPLSADQPGYETPVTRDAPVKDTQPPKPKLAKLEALVATATRKAGSFAPPGSCQWCDDRRKRDAARVARHRAKTAPKGGSNDGKDQTPITEP